MDYTGQHFDNYRLSRLLGHGTFGDVYEATDMRRNERVAIKVMEPLKTQRDVQNFLSEVRTLVRLRHRYIIPIRDFGVEPTNGIPFIVMPYASEGSLRQRHPKGTRVPLATVVQYVKQLAEALQYAHDDRSIHRDVKPENVLLGHSGELLLSDFGITTPSSSLFLDLNQPAPPSVAGSPVYMAPEQCRGKPEKASDQYALAIMTYEWLCGKPPFTGDTPLNIWGQHINDPVPPLHDKLPTISPEVEQVVMKALAKDPEQRFKSVQEFAEELEACLKPPIGKTLLLQRKRDQTAPPPTENTSSPPAASALFPTQIASAPIPITTTLLIYEHLGGQVVDAAWSPDGTRVVSGGEDRTVHIWDSATGQTLLTFQDIVQAVSWSPDGRLLALVSYDSSQHKWVVKIREASSGTLLHQYEGHTTSVRSVTWSPDGRLLASASYESVQVWEAATSTLVHRYEGRTDNVKAVAWSPDGRLLASASYKSVQVWEAISGKLLQLYEGHTWDVRALAWSPDGKQLASASMGSLITSTQVWEATTDTLVHRHNDYGDVDAMAWSPDGQLLALATSRSSKSVQVWEIASGKRLREYSGQSSYMPIVAWSSDGRLLTALDGRPQVWEPEIASDATLPQPRRNKFGGTFADQSHLRRGTLLYRYEGHNDSIKAVAWSPNGRLLASAAYQTGVQVREAGSGKLLEHYEGHTDAVTAIAWSPDGRQLASASSDKSVQVWEVASGKLVHRYQGHTNGVQSVTWSPDGRLLASASYKSVQVWEAATGTLVHHYEGLAGWVRAIAWSPDGRLLASASDDDKSVQVWEAISGTLVHRYEGHTDNVKAVAWSPGGRLLASASGDKSVQVWKPASGKLVYRYEGHSSSVGSVDAVAWSPNGGLLASTSYINGPCVQVWEVFTGKVLLTYRDHSPGVGAVAVAWSPDGKQIASWAGYEVRIWVAPH